MYILDTDHLSLIQRNNKAGHRILERLQLLQTPEVFVTIITYEEQVRGRLAFLSKSKLPEEQRLAYQGLLQLAKDYQSIRLLPFDKKAIIEYQRLKKLYSRLGSMDLKIAAITLSNNATLLTCNYSDFEKIVGLSFEDWSS